MRQVGTVVAGDSSIAAVAVRRQASCEKCGACEFGSRPGVEILARNEVGAQVGDLVVIELESHAVLTASAIVYAIPLVLMVIGFLAGPAVAHLLSIDVSSDAAAAVVGLGMLVVAFVGIHIYDRQAGPRQYMPRIVGIASGEETADCNRV